MPNTESYIWPPHCCVAAYVDAAVRILGGTVSDRVSLARELGTTTDPGMENPWHLPVTSEPLSLGVTAMAARQRLPQILQRIDQKLVFRHVPFATIAFEQYPEVFEQALSRGCVIGVGFDYTRLFGDAVTARHVARASVGGSSQEVLLFDDSHRALRSVATVAWPALEQAILAIDDGFWIIGERGATSLNHTLPD